MGEYLIGIVAKRSITMQQPPYYQLGQNQYHQPYHTQPQTSYPQWAEPPLTPQPPVPPPLMKKAQKGQEALRALIIVSLIILIPSIGYLYWPQITTALISIEPSCTVGITGTAATITIQGWQATQDCNNLFSGNQGPNALQIDPTKVYRLDSPPGEPVICQVDRGGLRITVRDEGILKLVGNAMCQAILSPTPQPSS